MIDRLVHVKRGLLVYALLGCFMIGCSDPAEQPVSKATWV